MEMRRKLISLLLPFQIKHYVYMFNLESLLRSLFNVVCLKDNDSVCQIVNWSSYFSIRNNEFYKIYLKIMIDNWTFIIRWFRLESYPYLTLTRKLLTFKDLFVQSICNVCPTVCKLLMHVKCGELNPQWEWIKEVWRQLQYLSYTIRKILSLIANFNVNLKIGKQDFNVNNRSLY